MNRTLILGFNRRFDPDNARACAYGFDQWLGAFGNEGLVLTLTHLDACDPGGAALGQAYQSVK